MRVRHTDDDSRIGRSIKKCGFVLAACFLLASGQNARSASPRKEFVVCDDVVAPSTLDPHRQFSEKSHTLLQQVYEGLVRFDPEGRVTPALAVSWERVGPLRMRFHLRHGVRFHDGTSFDAEAVRHSIRRIGSRHRLPDWASLPPWRAEVVDPKTVIYYPRPDGSCSTAWPASSSSFLAASRREASCRASRGHRPLQVHGGTRRTGGSFLRPTRTTGQRLSQSSRGWCLFLPGEQQVEALLQGEVDSDGTGHRHLRVMKRDRQGGKEGELLHRRIQPQRSEGPFG